MNYKVHFLVLAVSDPEVCGVCETVIQYVDSLLDENSTIAEIEKAMEKVCNFLPENIRKEVRKRKFTE